MVRLLPLLLVGVVPHQLPVAQVVDLPPLLLAADALLVTRPRLKHAAALRRRADPLRGHVSSRECVSHLLEVSSQRGDARRVEENDGALRATHNASRVKDAC